MRKKRILWVGEASFLKTGYAVYAKEVLTRLHKTGKYIIAELGSYGHWGDPNRMNIPWRYYGNMPTEGNEKEQRSYFSNPLNQFGEWSFEEVCLDFRPDAIFDIRDWWMFEFEQRSPLRRLFKWMIMPTVDSAPQDEQWINTFLDADKVLAYSEFGKEVLEKQTSGILQVSDIASPGANLDIFKPVKNKKEHRNKYNLDNDAFIIGTVMRNQRRKLYPDLMQAFRKFVDENPILSKNVYLYLHVTYPDYGWDIPKLIREHGLGNKVLVTYRCRKCNGIFPSFFQDARMVCVHCGSSTASMPSTRFGVSTEQLADIYNMFDVYVQYSICEGFGMPQIEAASCGIPVMTVDYSAMSSVGKNLGCYMIEVERFFREHDTSTYRALPSNEDFIKKLKSFINLPFSIKAQKGRKALGVVRRIYNWDNTAKIWEKNIDDLEISEESMWDSKPHINNPPERLPEETKNLSNEDFVRWCIRYVWDRSDMDGSYFVSKMIRDLNYGLKTSSAGGVYFNEASYLGDLNRLEDFGRKQAFQKILDLAHMRNYWEKRRVNMIQVTPIPLVENSKPGELE